MACFFTSFGSSDATFYFMPRGAEDLGSRVITLPIASWIPANDRAPADIHPRRSPIFRDERIPGKMVDRPDVPTRRFRRDRTEGRPDLQDLYLSADRLEKYLVARRHRGSFLLGSSISSESCGAGRPACARRSGSLRAFRNSGRAARPPKISAAILAPWRAQL